MRFNVQKLVDGKQHKQAASDNLREMRLLARELADKQAGAAFAVYNEVSGSPVYDYRRSTGSSISGPRAERLKQDSARALSDQTARTEAPSSQVSSE